MFLEDLFPMINMIWIDDLRPIIISIIRYMGDILMIALPCYAFYKIPNLQIDFFKNIQ